LQRAHRGQDKLGNSASLDESVILTLVKDAFNPYGDLLSRQGITAKKLALRTVGGPERLADGPDDDALLAAAASVARVLRDPSTGVGHLVLGILLHPDWPFAQDLASWSIDPGPLRAQIAALEALLADRRRKKKKDTEQTSTAVSELDQELASFGTDLNQRARDGELDQVIGRDGVIDELVLALSRREKNNPVLLGPPGVGKTAIVEGLAQRIVAERVPPALRGQTVLSLDMAAIIGGTRFRGDFEQRFERILKAAIADGRVILFIDEIHVLVEMSGTRGGIGAATLLKPYLARRGLQVIGATTHAEYDTYISQDAALARRFQPLTVLEPDPEAASRILNGLKPAYEEYHGIQISQEAIDTAVQLSDLYSPSGHLPDRAIDLLDVSCARAAVDKNTLVSSRTVSQVLAAHLNTNLDHVLSKEKWLLSLPGYLRARVVGQDSAVDTICAVVSRRKLGLTLNQREFCSFIFSGPEGVGKSRMAVELARWLYGEDARIHRFDMSDYAAPQSVWRFRDSTAGGSAFDVLGPVRQARLNPRSLIVLDSIERADRGVLELISHLVEEGVVEDGLGELVDFSRSCLVLMTSAVTSGALGAELGFGLSDTRARHGEDRARLIPLVGRSLAEAVDAVVCFDDLNQSALRSLLDLWLAGTSLGLSRQGLTVSVAPAARAELVRRADDMGSRAVCLRATLERDCEVPLSRLIVRGYISQGESLTIDCHNGSLGIVRAADFMSLDDVGSEDFDGTRYLVSERNEEG
jgi:ATP-dependent Clp protease ATP-binding subunit ClpC